MTTVDLHKILDDENRKLSLNELKQVIYEMKQDCFAEVQQHDVDSRENSYYYGEGNGFQIVLDLLEHFKEKSE